MIRKVKIFFSFIFVFCFSVSNMKGQNANWIDSIVASASYDSSLVIDTSEFVVSQYVNLNCGKTCFELESKVKSPFSVHLRYQQYLNKIKIYRAEHKVNLKNNGEVLSEYYTSFKDNLIGCDFPDSADYSEIVQKAKYFGILKLVSEQILFPTEYGLVPAQRIEIADSLGNYKESVIGLGGKILYEKDLTMYFNASRNIIELDTPAVGNVFFPDPLTSSGNSYGSPWVDSTNANTAPLQSQLFQKDLEVSFSNDSFRLENNFVRIRDFGAPYYPVAVSILPDFSYNRSQTGFEDVNVFYHLSYFNDYVRNTLGFSNICNYQIIADAHALNGSDNSNFNPAQNPPRLSFGDGGVDDAEDADVIVHEYGHAISHSAAPNTNNGIQRTAIDEGLGDYFASSYSRFINSFGWEKAYTWDGHNHYWAGRFTNSTDHYPEDLINNLYGDADIWSSVLMEIWGDIGREVTDKLLIQTAYSFASNMTMPQAALAFLQSDELLYASEHFQPIRDRMVARGLLPFDVSIPQLKHSDYRILNSMAFRNGDGNLIITSPNNESEMLKVFDAIGKLQLEFTFKNNMVEVSPNQVSNGIYILYSNGLFAKVIR